MVWNIAVALIANARSQSASVQSSTVPACTMPAQLKSTSRGPTSAARAAMADDVGDVQAARGAPGERRQQVLIEVGGDDLRALAHERLGACAADALRRRRHQRDLACQPSRHLRSLEASARPDAADDSRILLGIDDCRLQIDRLRTMYGGPNFRSGSRRPEASVRASPRLAWAGGPAVQARQNRGWRLARTRDVGRHPG